MKNKVIWITGASSGIGEAIVYEMNRMGAKIILSSRRETELERVKNICINPVETVKVLPIDLMDSQSFADKANQAISFFGKVDMLINNGGISQRAFATETSIDTVRKLMEVNFFGTVALTKAILPHMIERESGHIVVISSVMGKIGTRFRSSYAASKHALHGWFDCLRQEMYDYHIDVSLVCPGFVKTNITVNALTADGKPYNKMDETTEKGLSTEAFAKKLIPKLIKQKEEIYIGGSEICTIYLKRWAPALLNKLLKRINVT